MRVPLAFALGLATALAVLTEPAAAQSRPGVHDRQAKRGQTVPLFRFYIYVADRGCTPLPAPEIDSSPRPKLGKVASFAGAQLLDGPCGRMEYPTLTVTYTAGSTPGVEEFELFFYVDYYGSSPDRRSVRMTVR